MEAQNDFLQRTRALREALKQKAQEIESNTTIENKSDLLETQIQKNIQSSVQFYRTNPNHESRNQSYSLKSLIELQGSIRNTKAKKATSNDPFKLPEIRKIYLPYLKKPSEFPLPIQKKIKKIRVNFTGIEPKIKKLNLAYSTSTSRSNY